MTAMRRIAPTGIGRSWPKIDAESVPNGIVASQATTGKASEAAARRDMVTSNPSTASAGHSALTIARAISLPSGPNSSHAGGSVVVGWLARGDATGVPGWAEMVEPAGRITRKVRTTETSATART